MWLTMSKKLYFCSMETNRQKKIAGVIQKDLVDILQGEVRKNGVSNLVISVSKVYVTSDLSFAKLQLRRVPNLTFKIDDSLDYIEKIDNALNSRENPIENRDLLEKRKKS